MDINAEARRLNTLLGGGRGAPILKPVASQVERDRLTWDAVEAYAGENGLTVDEVVAQWPVAAARNHRTTRRDN